MRTLRRSAAFCIGIGLSLFMTACGGSTTPPPPTTYVLTVNSTNPVSGVAITVSPTDINGATNGTTSFTRTYDAGTSVTLTAPATSGGNTFASWTGCTSSSGATCTLAMNANTTVTASYAVPVTYVLTVNSTNPASGVAITVSPADNNSAANGTTSFTRTYNAAASVTLTAPATSGGNTFTSWTGCTSSSGATCTVAMSANTTVTANYATPVPTTYVLTVNSTNPASGVSIGASPADNNNTTTGTTAFTLTYNSGTTVTLTAPATSGGSNFSSWTGCTTASTVTCTVTISANTTVTANYTPTYVLTVNSTNPASGIAVSVSPTDNSGATIGTTSFTRTYNSGTSVTLTAPATSGGNNFSSWSGCTTASTVTCTVTISANTTVTANYTPAYVLTVNSTNPASGVTITVTYPPTTLATQGTTSFTVNGGAGETLVLTAPVTSGGNNFSSWTGCTSASTLSCNVTLNANMTVTANYMAPPTITSFVASPATIGVGESPSLTAVFANGTGVITPGNHAVTSGTPVTVSPTATTTYTLTITPATGTPVTQTTTVTVIPAPSITSFAASPTTIAGGTSTSLTAVFANGTGVITPGGLAVTSGKAVSVSPTTTTAYTLTVTPPTGNAITQTATVTVTGTTIASFVASPALITAGATSSLTGIFANGTGMITPGNLPATSGTAVTVTPSTSTVYTLTVTPTSGTPVTQTALVAVANAVIAVDQSSSGPAVSDQLLGMNLAAWYDATNSTNAPAIKTAFETAGIKAVRWPGGSWSDGYNWETNTECGGTANSDDDFTDFVNKLVIPTGLDLTLTADYGTGEKCTGPGQPTEAAAWVANALTLGVTVSHMTVGNEEFGSWETDNHSSPHNGATYAAAVAGTNGYYALIKAASPNTLVGVDVDPDYAPWDQDVMSGAPYDFVEYHKYPETPGQESDSFLVNQGAQFITNEINAIKSELAKWGTPDTPIYVGEIGGPYSNPGKQSWSITQGLYAGQVLGEMMNDGVSRLTWWIGFGNCNGSSGNDKSTVYGWQNFGAYNVFSDGSSDPTCPGAGPLGTMSPTAQAFSLFQNVAVTGESVLTASVAGDSTDVRAYAATHSGGTALVLFNVNETTSEPVTVTLSGQTASTGVTVETYSKAIYDLSGSPTGTPPDPAGTSTWAPRTTTSLGAQSLPLSLTLAPWSMNVVIIQ